MFDCGEIQVSVLVETSASIPTLALDEVDFVLLLVYDAKLPLQTGKRIRYMSKIS
jgi:hypothetical protein